MEFSFFVLLALCGIIAVSLSIMNKLRPQFPWIQRVFIALCCVAGFFFSVGMFIHSNPYHQPIDPVDTECYSPFGAGQWPTVVFYALGFYIGIFFLWWKGNRLPPLTGVCAAVFVCIGLVLNSLFIIQLWGHDTSSLGQYGGYDDGFWLLVPLPALNVLAAVSLLYHFVIQQQQQAGRQTFKNAFLQKVNQFMASHYHRSVWVILLLFPVLLLSTLILFLFGQDYNSLVRVFTDTTTWTFSQKTHPPILDHRGHYLCTVAAKGDPKVVKPVRLGTRGGRTIIVNRQLQVANAFEELVRDISPALHRFIRRNYDRYGYNLSRKINSPFWSNLTYLLMKPLEWFFLACLYACCRKPEQKIKRQYLSILLLFALFISCGNPGNRQAETAPVDSVSVEEDPRLRAESASADSGPDPKIQALYELTKQVLEKQLREGAVRYYGSGDADGYEMQKAPFTSDELKAFAFQAENILRSNGQLEWSNAHFTAKIKEIFGISIPTDSSALYRYINLWDPCYPEPLYHRNNGIDYNGLFIIKPENLISDFYYIPEIIEYQFPYSELAEAEATFPTEFTETIDGTETEIHIEKWMDLENRNDEYNLAKQRKENRIQILYRNRFLLGEDDSCLDWLLLHDSFFMESLVKKFGWTNNEKLLYRVIAITPFDKTQPDDFGSLFWNKDCDGNLKIHANTFKLLQKHYKPDAAPEIRRILYDIADYLDYMMGSGAYSRYTRPELSDRQRLEILANMVYFAEQYKYKTQDNGVEWSGLRMMGRLRYYLSLKEHENEREILQANDYFGLPKFKEWWDAADYDLYYIDGEWNGPWGRDNQPLTEPEWRMKITDLRKDG